MMSVIDRALNVRPNCKGPFWSFFYRIYRKYTVIPKDVASNSSAFHLYPMKPRLHIPAHCFQML